MRSMVFDVKGLLVDHSDFKTLEEYQSPEMRKRLGISDKYAGECLTAVLDAMLHYRESKNVIVVIVPKEAA